MAAACRDVEAATLARDGSPPITRITLPTCRAHYPGGSSGCACRLLPRSRGLPQMAGGDPHCHFRGLLRLHSRYGPSDCSAALRRPLSRGSSPSGCPAEPLVSYRINRQLSGWNPPPLVIRAFGAHCHNPTSSAGQDREGGTAWAAVPWIISHTAELWRAIVLNIENKGLTPGRSWHEAARIHRPSGWCGARVAARRARA